MKINSYIIGVPFAALALWNAGDANAQSLWKPGARCGFLISDRTARRVGDTITIVISEQQSIQNKNNTKIERTSSLSAVPKTVQLTTHTPISLPALEVDSSRKMDAKADSQKTGVFTTTLSGTVLDVQPNGNLIVIGRRKIVMDGDEKTIEITGIVRPYDVSSSNTVTSSQIAEARITFVGEGPVSEASEKGLLARGWDILWNFIWPF